MPTLLKTLRLIVFTGSPTTWKEAIYKIGPTRCVILLCLLFISIFGRSQNSNLHFKHLTIEEGLPSSNVLCMIQDRHGFIWIGTSNGLSRYDGYNFSIYRNDPDDSLSLSDNYISTIIEDSKGKFWIGTNSGGLNYFDPETGQFQRFQHDPKDSLSLSQNQITDITEDHLGYIWVGTRQGGLNCLDRKTGHFKKYVANAGIKPGIGSNYVTIVFEDSLKQLWVGSYHFGLAWFDREKEQFHHIFPRQIPLQKLGSDDPWGKYFVNDVYIDKEEKFWMATDSGLYHLDPGSRKYELFFFPDKDPLGSISFHLSLSRDHAGFLWVTGVGGISRIHPSSKTTESFFCDPDNAWNLPKAMYYYCSLIDREGILWVGSDKGLSRHDGLLDRFQNYPVGSHQIKGLNEDFIGHIQEDSEGTLWVDSEKGLHRIEPQSGQHVLYELQHSAPSTIWRSNIYCMLEDEDGIFWISIINNGLGRLDKTTGRYHYIGTKNIGSLRHISSIYKDREGMIWLATWGGVYQFDPRAESFHPVPWKSADGKGRAWTDVSVIFEDSEGTLWVGTNFGELKSYERTTGLFHEYLPDSQIRYGKTSVSCIHEDLQGILWIGTTGDGLIRLDKKEKNFTHFREKDGLANNGIAGILEDGRGVFWISTSGGLSKFNPQKKEFRNYHLDDGLPSIEFSNGFSKSKKNGIFYFGTVKGLVAFHPDSIKEDSYVPPVHITSFRRYNTKAEEQRPVEEKGISEKKEISLSYQDNILTFEFAALSFRKTAKNQYAYKLEGFNDTWIQLGTKREVTFTNLDPGDYTLRVKGSNGDGIWNEEGASLKITITPPWWATWWAKTLYALAAIGLFLGLRHYDVNRKLAKAETLRLKELDAVKTKLYTNITHEFRTPVTVILGMTRQIKEHPKEWLHEGLQMIERNGKNLLNLVNQMLDLRKLESGTLSVKLVQGDVLSYLQYIAESFQSFAESKNIRLHFDFELSEFVMDYDPEKMLSIVSNLLSNAIKFSPEGGVVALRASTDFRNLILTVSDTGAGIPSEKLPYIFDRFYQADDAATRKAEGTGIGLALTQKLVNLLNGDIFVQSQPGAGTIFTVLLPITHTATLEELPGVAGLEEQVMPFVPVVAEALATKATTTGPPEQPLVLLIEDNSDVIRYLTACLQQHYRIAVAANGQKGVHKATGLVPDLIVSDVMMPEMDGFEVTQILKNDERTSHIPIILLTAKTDMDSKMEGLERGADAYLTKPFHQEELLIRLKKLLELRHKLRQHYLSLAGHSGAALSLPEEVALEKTENVFVQKVRVKVEAHLNDSHFNVQHLCREVGMSHSQLHRKLAALTGYSSSRFIRYIRLSKAKNLLSETDETIASVAFDTGFSDPAYFTRVFRKEFGVAPTEFKQYPKGGG
jgi:signal transduction histidine kinase/ligand-binding sensor domain-containing protein/DNA-binding response OmpR family regulator